MKVQDFLLANNRHWLWVNRKIIYWKVVRRIIRKITKSMVRLKKQTQTIVKNQGDSLSVQYFITGTVWLECSQLLGLQLLDTLAATGYLTAMLSLWIFSNFIFQHSPIVIANRLHPRLLALACRMQEMLHVMRWPWIHPHTILDPFSLPL